MNLSTIISPNNGIETKNSFQVLTDKFKKLQEDSEHFQSTNNIPIAAININGLRGKKAELQAYLDTYNIDVVALLETKFDFSVKTNELIPDSLGYDTYRKDRTGKAGGTMLLVNKTLKSAPFTKLNNKSESLWCKLMIQGQFHYLSSWYRQPSAHHHTIVLLKEQLVTIKDISKNNDQPFIHVLGDFNYPKICWDSMVNKVNTNSLCDSEGQSLIDIINVRALLVSG